MTDLLTPPTRRDAPSDALPVLLAGALVGLAAGAGTGWLQGELSGSWHVLADSGAVWTVVAFLAASVARTRWVAVAVGALTLLAEVAGYYVLAAHALGFSATVSEQVLWTVAALWLGPLAGLAAHTWRHGTPAWSLTGVLGVLGLTAGEGLHQLLRIHDAAAGWGETGLAGVAGAAAVWTSRAGPAQRAAALVAACVVCVAVYAVYGQAVLS